MGHRNNFPLSSRLSVRCETFETENYSTSFVTFAFQHFLWDADSFRLGEMNLHKIPLVLQTRSLVGAGRRLLLPQKLLCHTYGIELIQVSTVME